MKERPIEVRAQLGPWSSDIQLLVLAGESAGVLTMEPVADGAMINPTARLGRREAQTLMDDLWQCGFRPSAARGGSETLRATENHLQDMRAIAFAKSKVELPQ